MREAFPEAFVVGYSDIEVGLTNHEKDRHVLAAAIRSGAQTIVTFNTRHFPIESTRVYDIEPIHPDEFLVNQFHLDDALVVNKFVEQANAIGRTIEDQLRNFHKTRVLPFSPRALLMLSK